jgi:hypothetical protein
MWGSGDAKMRRLLRGQIEEAKQLITGGERGWWGAEIREVEGWGYADSLKHVLKDPNAVRQDVTDDFP